MAEIVGGEGYQQFEGLSPAEVDALEDQAYMRVFSAQTPEEARAAYADIRLIARFICKEARGE